MLDPRPERRLAMLALALIVPVPTLGVIAAMVTAPGPVGRLVFLAAKAWLLVLPVAWRALVDRDPPSWSPPQRGGLGAGLLLGIATAVPIGVTAWVVLPGLDRAALGTVLESMGLATPSRYLAAAAAWTLANSLIEEYVWRWFVLTRCERLTSGGAAVSTAALLFTVHHAVAMSRYLTPGLTVLACIGVFIGGWIWGWCYRRYRSIWPGWIAHVLADVAVFTAGWFLAFG